MDGRIRIAAAATWLPEQRYPAAVAVSAGVVTAQQVSGALCHEVPVAGELPAWRMGLRASQNCLVEAGLDSALVDLVAYAGTTPAEEEPWSPAHRIARLLGASHAVAIGLAQMSNGGAAGIGYATAQLLADHDLRHALSTTAGNFSALPYDRWRTAPATVFGDGATAVLLGRDQGPLALRSLGSAGNPMLEESFPAVHPYRPLPEAESGARADTLGFALNVKGFRGAVQSAVHTALADGGLADTAAHDRIAVVTANRLAPQVTEHVVVRGLPRALRSRYHEFGLRTGHLGAGDVPAGLADILAGDLLDVGDCALLIGTGAGVTATALVVERV